MSSSEQLEQSDQSNGNSSKIAIRTLYITPIHPDMNDAIEAYFMQFGEVKSVEMHQNGDGHYGFVEFKTVDAAAAVLSNTVHRIANSNIEVKAADPWHQPDHILNALDDDCLHEVFKYLDEWDLTNAAEVCIYNFGPQIQSMQHRTGPSSS